MEFWRKNTWWIGLLAIAAVYFYFFNKNPCDSPIEYKIGRIDSGFGISNDKLLSSIRQASAIWSKPVQKSLFDYNPNGTLTINLIYDDRQKTTQQNAELKADVEKTSQLAANVKAQYEQLNANLAASKAEYNAELASFNQKQEAYSTQVNYWNSQGGAPPAEYNALQTERLALEDQHTLLEQKRVALNSTVNQINDFIKKYNLLVQNANANISVINQTAGQEFQEGSYDPKTNTINIYEYSTPNKLTRVLAHELGHALGLEHNDNASSIMYGLNQSNTLVLSKDDIAALDTLCKN